MLRFGLPEIREPLRRLVACERGSGLPKKLPIARTTRSIVIRYPDWTEYSQSSLFQCLVAGHNRIVAYPRSKSAALRGISQAADLQRLFPVSRMGSSVEFMSGKMDTRSKASSTGRLWFRLPAANAQVRPICMGRSRDRRARCGFVSVQGKRIVAADSTHLLLLSSLKHQKLCRKAGKRVSRPTRDFCDGMMPDSYLSVG